MGSVELTLEIERKAGADIMHFAVGVERGRVTILAAVTQRDGRAVVLGVAKENGLAAALGIGEILADGAVPIGGTRYGAKVVMQVVELIRVERLDAGDEHGQAGAALASETGVDPDPFVGGHVVDAAEGAVVDGSHADAVVFDVVDDVVDVAVGMASAAGELATEGDAGVMEQPLATPPLAEFRVSTERDDRLGGEGLEVNDSKRIVERVGHVGAPAVG